MPGDVGLIGLNDMEMAGWQNINLTTIRQPIRQIIHASIELVLAMMDDPARAPEYRLFLCDIIDRGTLLPTSDGNGGNGGDGGDGGKR